MRGVKKGVRRTGCIYTEYHYRGKNRGASSDSRFGWHSVRGVGLKRNYMYRYVAEIYYYGKRYRCRSAHYERVKAWLDEMIEKFNG